MHVRFPLPVGIIMSDIYLFLCQAHERRRKQFDTEALKADPKDNSWDILDRLTHKSPKAALTSSGTSKRAEKRVGLPSGGILIHH